MEQQELLIDDSMSMIPVCGNVTMADFFRSFHLPENENVIVYLRFDYGDIRTFELAEARKLCYVVYGFKLHQKENAHIVEIFN